MKDTIVDSTHGDEWTYCCLHINPKTCHIAYMRFSKSEATAKDFEQYNGMPSAKDDIRGKGYEYWYVHKDELT